MHSLTATLSIHKAPKEPNRDNDTFTSNNLEPRGHITHTWQSKMHRSTRLQGPLWVWCNDLPFRTIHTWTLPYEAPKMSPSIDKKSGSKKAKPHSGASLFWVWSVVPIDGHVSWPTYWILFGNFRILYVVLIYTFIFEKFWFYVFGK